MDGRRVSSLSVGSNESEGSGGTRVGELLVEEVGQVSLAEGVAGTPTALTSQGSLLCLLQGDQHVWVSEIRLRPDTEVSPSRSSLLALPGREERRYLDCCILSHAPSARIALLFERKNKERVVSVVGVNTTGRSIVIGEELATYDKVAMLGKNLSHLTSGGGEDGEDLYVFGSIVRKLRVEDEGRVLRPTTGRVPIPPECADGTIAVCVTGSNNKKGSSLLCSSRTKSAGKNKFQLNWLQVKKDELSSPSGKSAVKLPEEQEPSVVLCDPRDARGIYVICNNHLEGTSSLFKVSKGRRPEDALHVFPYQVSEAAFLNGPDRTLFLFLLETTAAGLRVLQLSRAEGFRGQEGQWSRAPNLTLGPGPSTQALNCAQSKWQLNSNTAEALVAHRAPYQAGLATLLNSVGEVATEPESGLPYRVRLLGADQCPDCLMVLLDDLERSFEGEEDTLTTSCLKLCLTSSPAREGMSQLSAWLMGGRLAAAEIQVGRPDRDCPGGSERLAIIAISPDTIRHHLVEHDWTEGAKREGTFVLDNANDSPSPAAIRSSAPAMRTPSATTNGLRSRIPSANNGHRRSPDPSLVHTNGSNGLEAEEITLAIARVEEAVSPLARASTQIRDSLSLLEKNLAQLKTASARSMESSMIE